MRFLSRGARVLLWGLIFVLTCGNGLVLAQDVDVDVTVEAQRDRIDQPLSGTITVTHPVKSQVVPDSFLFQGKPLATNLVNRTLIGDKQTGTMLSIYHFNLPAQPPGSYTLTPITVTVGKASYSSLDIRYKVEAPALQSQPSSHTQAATLFTLETEVSGSSPLYPGQRATLTYYITYNQSIDLTFSELPLLYSKDLHKIGEPRIDQIQDPETGITIQQISQEVEAFKPGTFHFDKSIIEGYAYEVGSDQSKRYFPNKLHAEASPVDIVVAPFPKENQPLSFTGAIGDLKVETELLSPEKTPIGDKVVLQIKVSGSSNLEDLSLPNISCQPEFSGFFLFDNLWPAGSVQGRAKIFKMQLSPLSSFIQEIPPIELASFDPKTASYETHLSKPLPIQIIQEIGAIPSTQHYDGLFEATALADLQGLPAPPLEIRESVIPTTTAPLSWWMKPPTIFYLIPLGALLLLLQLQIKRKWSLWREQVKPPKSSQLLKEALKESDAYLSIKLLKEAILQRLHERNESLVNHATARKFIDTIEALQYGGLQLPALAEIKKEAKALFSQL